MAMHSWIASEALKSACDKGHNWITSRANKFKSVKSGYCKIQPRILPKGLTTFRKEHCDGFDDDSAKDTFLKCRDRTQSVDVIDHRMKADFVRQIGDGVVYDFRQMNMNGLEIKALPKFTLNFYFENICQM
jgi:hypothetical protein